MNGFSRHETRVLILAALKRDGELTKKILHGAGIEAEVCADATSLCEETRKGAGALLIGGETLRGSLNKDLRQLLDEQPAWSHVPVIIIAGQPAPILSREAPRGIGVIPNVTLLERPVRTATLVSVLRAALADRRRQYETKHLLERLERSNLELNHFAHIASHDLQEPLRTMTTYVQLLKRELGPNLNPEALEYINFVVDSSKRMKDLISSLLTYAQVGASEIEFLPVNTDDVVRKAIKALEAKIQEAGATIVVDSDLPPLAGNPTLLTQLFQNLIHNAVKFRKADVPPQVRIRAARLNFHALFSVEDNGIGINERHLGQIFQIFKRLHTAEEYPGSGIGLAVCKKIVERHHGNIQVESEEGKGTIFRFALSLPAESSETESAATA